MKIDKKYKGLKNVGWRYELDGDLITDEHLEIDLDMGLFVKGSIEAGEYIKAGGSIKAGWSIEAGEYIEAGGSIKAGWYIKAGGYIKGEKGISAGLSIKCKTLNIALNIFAGVCTWEDIKKDDLLITCEELQNGTIRHGELNILPKTEIKEMTVAEISQVLGYEVKVVK
jgi:hypothetical protein